MSKENDEFQKAFSDSFIAIVDGPATEPREWLVKPQIIEMDGTDFPQITVSAGQGITPAVGDKVLVLTMRNNLDFEKISRFYPASASNGVIIAVVDTDLFESTGEYTITGSLQIGDGSQKMVRGDDLKAFCEDVLAALTTIKNWATTTTAPSLGAPLSPALVLTVPTFPDSVLSETNTLE